MPRSLFEAVMHKVLVSACLLGEAVRYDGGDCRQNGQLAHWQNEGRLISLCPEVAGGLPVPRAPAEIQADGRVLTIRRDDVSSSFETGAQAALDMCQRHGIRMAVLKEGSPSCATHRINDGQFSGIKVAGKGVTTRLLEAHDIRVFSENEVDRAASYLAQLEGG